MDSRTAIQDLLRACADEPIHIPGSVQRHGFFLLTQNSRVVVASENAEEFLRLPVKLILGAQLDALLDREVLASIAMSGKTIGTVSPTTYLGAFRVGSELCSVLSHCIDDRLALEFERVDRVVMPELMNAVMTNFVTTLGSVRSEQALCDAVAAQVHELTGYDRTMLYSFDAEGHGLVLAEVNTGPLTSYKGLYFPASDIPAQARALYLRNTTRVIPDALYTPSPLLGLPGESAASLDLSQSVLRSVSPVHVQYMRNMGTMASMSISIVTDGRLWGLIGGHHSEPKTVPYLIRSACDMLAKMMSTQLTALRTAERLRKTVKVHAVQRTVLTRLTADAHFLQSLREQMPHLLELVDASGVALLADGRVDRQGVTPDDAAITRLGEWLDASPEVDVVETRALGERLPWAKELRATGSGLLAIRISSVRPRYVMWFRPQLVETVQWAGEPVKTVGPMSLSPRASFEAWKETVYGRAAEWNELEVQSAQDFRAALASIGLRQAEEAVELGEARFQQLTAAVPARVFVCDDVGRLTFVNQRWPARPGSSDARWFEDGLLAPEDSDRCTVLWGEAVRANQAFETEVRLKEEDGALRWNFVRVVPFQRAGAARAGWIGTLIDVTDSKERELVLRTNDKLALSGRMTSVIAHEINNPLEAITNLMYLLRSQVPEQGPASGYIDMVETELQRISGITKQTLRWNREQTDLPAVFGAGALVDEVLRLFAGKLRNRHVHLEVTGDTGIELRGVVGQIRQALANLLSNAIDAVPLHGTVQIALLRLDPWAGLAVRDDGPGIAPDVRERLFEPFVTTKGDLGNGLGLYITKEIVERHGGELRVESVAGAGTTMTILLPAA